MEKGYLLTNQVHLNVGAVQINPMLKRKLKIGVLGTSIKRETPVVAAVVVTVVATAVVTVVAMMHKVSLNKKEDV